MFFLLGGGIGMREKMDVNPLVRVGGSNQD
jgi:hypothetical protein